MNEPATHQPSRFRSVARDLFCVVALTMLFQTCVADGRRVVSGSMEPQLRAGDLLLVNNILYRGRALGFPLPGFRTPERGEVVTFRRGDLMVKRVVGLPGDRLAMRGGRLWRNGEFLDEPYVALAEPEVAIPRAALAPLGLGPLPAEDSAGMLAYDNWGPLVVADGMLFVLGDNRWNSADSRIFGGIPMHMVRGRPSLIYWSYDPNAPTRLPALTAVRWERVFRSVE